MRLDLSLSTLGWLAAGWVAFAVLVTARVFA
jgi:hypothetical protein